MTFLAIGHLIWAFFNLIKIELTSRIIGGNWHILKLRKNRKLGQEKLGKGLKGLHIHHVKNRFRVEVNFEF
jgi:hypothetical protein